MQGAPWLRLQGILLGPEVGAAMGCLGHRPAMAPGRALETQVSNPRGIAVRGPGPPVLL